jgi:hypothetical protein
MAQMPRGFSPFWPRERRADAPVAATTRSDLVEILWKASKCLLKGDSNEVLFVAALAVGRLSRKFSKR